ncbi:DUF2752 domain-containing protein [Granulicoccus phenolivorans]|uniref:DUF2752 domain-containing protein n=1 Tax=Granulicoccus phenolivorans TaxID=266854 RepID=UPI0004134B86|nr:DUF2752 domain-containing protein [Granulicoccus phenolivorans]
MTPAPDPTAVALTRGLARLGWLSLFGGTCVLAGGVYAVTGHGIPCPVLHLTGLLCPVCGSSRMGVALLHGDVAAAWAWNPFMLLLAAALAALYGWTLIRVLQRRPANLPGVLGELDRRPTWQVLLGVVLIGVVFAVGRNLLR